MSPCIFLSTVSGAFGSWRRRFARMVGRTKRVQVRHQDDFLQHGVTTLHTLEEEVQASQWVVHVLGHAAGWLVPSDQVVDFLERHPGFAQRFAAIAQRGRDGQVSATQWEAWLAKFFGKRLLPYAVGSEAGYDESQREHLALLRSLEIHPAPVDDENALHDGVVEALLQLGVFDGAALPRPVVLPFRSIGDFFVGRQDKLQELRVCLERGAASPPSTRIAALHGLGGVGKTRLAVEYAWGLVDAASALLFITADTPLSLDRNLAALTRPDALDLAEHEATDDEIRVAAVLRSLQRRPGWLLILDNVDREDAAQAVDALLARMHGGQVIIATRVSKWAADVEQIQVDVLSAEDAARYLLRKTEPLASGRGRRASKGDDVIAKALAVELGGLALAIEQAAAYIATKRMPLAKYLEVWRSHTVAAQEWFDRTIAYAGPSDTPPRTMATTWLTTLEELRLDRQSGAAALQILDRLACLAPDPLPLGVLAPDFGGDDPLEAALALLVDYSLVTWDVEARTVAMHRVLQRVLFTRLPDPRAHVQAAIACLDAALPEGDASDPATWPAWEALRPHVVHVLGESERFGTEGSVQKLLRGFGALLFANARYMEAEPLMRRALRFDQASRRKGHPDTAISLSNLAQVLQATDRLREAESLMRQALLMDEAAYGPDHQRVAIQLNNLAELCAASKRFSEAEPLMRRALSIFEAALGSDHPHVAIVHNNLGRLLHDAGRLFDAEMLMRRALSILEQAYGRDDPRIVASLNNLGLLLHETRHVGDAEPLLRRAQRISAKALGSDHPHVATASYNLALLLQDAGRLADAEPMLRRSLSILSRGSRSFELPGGLLRQVYRDYTQLLRAQGLDDGEIEARLAEVVTDLEGS